MLPPLPPLSPLSLLLSLLSPPLPPLRLWCFPSREYVMVGEEPVAKHIRRSGFAFAAVEEMRER
jgi:hypothetical protein